MQVFSNIKWLLHVCIIAMVCALIGACATGRPSEPPVQRIEPNFDYNPSETTAGKTGITFAAVGSQFEMPYAAMGGESQYGGVPFGTASIPLFERFADNMADDFSEIITARGYTLRGPFRTFDEMTFIDKDNSNLILTAKVDFNTDFSGTSVTWDKPWLEDGSYKVSGQVRISCRVSLIISESLTNEKMWTKSVNIRPITVELTPMRGYSSRYIPFEAVLKNDDKFYTSLGLKLDRQYHEIMNRTYGYLDPREMALINKQAGELRKRKTF